MAIGTPTSVTSGTSTSNATAYATASVTPTAGQVVFFASASRTAAGSPTQPTVTGVGATWAPIDFVGSGGRSVFLAWGYTSSYSTGAITVTYPETQTHCMWSVFEASGVDTTTAEVQSKTASGSSTSAGASFDSAFGASGNMTLLAVVTRAVTVSITPDGSLAEIHEVSQAENIGDLSTSYYVGEDATPSATISSSASWSVIIAEIKEAGAAANLRRYTMPLTGVG